MVERPLVGQGPTPRRAAPADEPAEAVIAPGKAPGGLADLLGRDPASGPVHCANCIHCKLVPSASGVEGRYRLRVRCDAGKWRKKLGEEKIYKYFTVARRSIPSCDRYEDMGDAEEFLRDLRRFLPAADEEYSL